jgi:hypothetical protein
MQEKISLPANFFRRRVGSDMAESAAGAALGDAFRARRMREKSP